jgi:hypothetical protein
MVNYEKAEEHSRPSRRLRCLQIIARRRLQSSSSTKTPEDAIVPTLAQLWSLLQKRLKAAEKTPRLTKQVTYTAKSKCIVSSIPMRVAHREVSNILNARALLICVPSLGLRFPALFLAQNLFYVV